MYRNQKTFYCISPPPRVICITIFYTFYESGVLAHGGGGGGGGGGDILQLGGGGGEDILQPKIRALTRKDAFSTK